MLVDATTHRHSVNTMLDLIALCFLAFLLTAKAENFTNPVIYEDFADNDIFFGPDGSFYYSASSFHYSPGAPILKSDDLVNWDLIGHSVPTLEFGSNYYMEDGQTAYNGGIWASTLRYSHSNNKWYWIGCVNFWTTYVYTAPDVTGPWNQAASFQPCFYDCGMLIDDDGTMYVAYGSDTVSVARLSSDGLSIAQTQEVFTYPQECTGIEGNRMYKRSGIYYILDDCPAEGITEIWKSLSPFGPYERKILSNGTPSPVPNTGPPDQGSLIETANGEWYFMSFAWAYPLGRVPVLAPITWGSDDYPVLGTVDGTWAETYPYPLPQQNLSTSWIGGDQFWGNSLGPMWEWNHNPDMSKFALNNPGLTLYTATITDDLYHANNTLTHRPNGQYAIGTVEIDFSEMADGDQCGLAAFRDQSAWIGVVRNGDGYTVTAVQGLAQNSSDDWATASTGYVVGTAPIPQGKVWLQVAMELGAESAKQSTFSYSTDGNSFTQLGGGFTLESGWSYFMGYRYGIFNFATRALGGSIDVISFTSWTD